MAAARSRRGAVANALSDDDTIMFEVPSGEKFGGTMASIAYAVHGKGKKTTAA